MLAITFPIMLASILHILSELLLRPTQPRGYIEHFGKYFFFFKVIHIHFQISFQLRYFIGWNPVCFSFIAPQRDRETKTHHQTNAFRNKISKFPSPIVKLLILSQIFIEHQDQLHNLQSPVQSRNTRPLVQKIRISRQQSIKPSSGACGNAQVTYPPKKLALLSPQILCWAPSQALKVEQWPFNPQSPIPERFKGNIKDPIRQ